MLRLAFECKICGEEHQVPRNWQDRYVDPTEGGRVRVDGKMLEFECVQQDATGLYSRGDIRWAESSP